MAENRKIDAPKVLDGIMKEAAAVLKPYGFRKHGRTLHRFVDGDISQAITFELGQAYLNQTHYLGIEVGVRVPECANRSFGPDEAPRKYYQAYMSTIRSQFGEIEGKRASWYDLRGPVEPIAADIIRQIRDVVLPAFELLKDRDAVLNRRQELPNIDQFAHLILIDAAMIHGRRGEMDKAAKCFRQYYGACAKELQTSRYPDVTRSHMQMIEDLARGLNIELDRPT